MCYPIQQILIFSKKYLNFQSEDLNFKLVLRFDYIPTMKRYYDFGGRFLW